MSDGIALEIEQRRILAIPGNEEAIAVENREAVLHAFDNGGEQIALFADVVSHTAHRSCVVAEYLKSAGQSAKFVASACFRRRLLGIALRKFAHDFSDTAEAADHANDHADPECSY